jgi:hypothetical protein
MVKWKRAVWGIALSAATVMQAVADDQPVTATLQESEAAAVDGEPNGEVAVQVDGQVAEKAGDVVDKAADEQANSFWVGLELSPLDEALREQLGLTEGQGLIVLSTIPESPAARAGIARYDVILTADETPINEPGSLGKVVREKKQSPIKLVVIRKGQKREIIVTPDRRPAEFKAPAVLSEKLNVRVAGDADAETARLALEKQALEIQAAIDRLQSERNELLNRIHSSREKLAKSERERAEQARVQAEQARVKKEKEEQTLLRQARLMAKAHAEMRKAWLEEQRQNPNARMEAKDRAPWFFNPATPLGGAPNEGIFPFGGGVVVASHGPSVSELPENVEVTIIRKGKGPAKVIVKEGDNTTEATEDKMDGLKDHHKAYLFKSLILRPAGMEPMHGRMVWTPAGPQGLPGTGTSAFAPPFEKLARQIEELTKAVQELKTQLSEKK